MEEECYKLMLVALKGYPSIVHTRSSKLRFTVLAQIMHLCDHPGFAGAYRKVQQCSSVFTDRVTS